MAQCTNFIACWSLQSFLMKTFLLTTLTLYYPLCTTCDISIDCDLVPLGKLSKYVPVNIESNFPVKVDRNGIIWLTDSFQDHQFLEICLNNIVILKTIAISKVKNGYYAFNYFYLFHSIDRIGWKEAFKKFRTSGNSVKLELDGFLGNCFRIMPIILDEIKSIGVRIEFDICYFQVCKNLNSTRCVENCELNYNCNGTHCVKLTECPCVINGVILAPGEICKDNCDELLCRQGRSIHRTEFTCKTKSCGQDYDKIIDYNTCSCKCVCNNEELKCGNASECLSKEQICNGVQDCRDGSDESCCPVKYPKVINCTWENSKCDEIKQTGVCRFRENTVITFDKQIYTCDTCLADLIRDISNEHFSVRYEAGKYIGTKFHHFISINHDDVKIVIGPRLFAIPYIKIGEYIDTYVRVIPSKPFIRTEAGFKIEALKDGMLFTSFKYGFSVTWRVNNILDIEVNKCLYNRIEGMCGHFNDKITYNKFHRRNNRCLENIQRFCYFYHSECDTKHIRNSTFLDIAADSCQRIQYEIRENCDVTQLEMRNDSYNDHVTICPDVIYAFCSSRESGCDCEALKYFIQLDICNSEVERKLLTSHKCDHCPYEFQWKRCGIDKTCYEFLRNETGRTGGEGCYCPENLIRIGNRCSPVMECKSCVCSVQGDSIYRTFDNKEFRIERNCLGIYLLVQPTSKAHGPHFQIFGVNERCSALINTTCTAGVIIKYNHTILEVYANKSVIRNNQVETSTCQDTVCNYDGIAFTHDVKSNVFQFKLKTVRIKVTYALLATHGQGVGSIFIKLPPGDYFNRTEGLCGSCNDNKSDDLSLRNGAVVDDVITFALEWLEEKDKRSCLIYDSENCTWDDAMANCRFDSQEYCSLYHSSQYYSKHVQSCINDLKCSPKIFAEDICHYKIFYAKICCQNFVPVTNWLREENCSVSCPENQSFRCVDVCQTKCPAETDIECQNQKIMKMTCACPDGFVEKDNTCIRKEECEICTTKPDNLLVPAGYYTVNNCTNTKPINTQQCVEKCHTALLYDSNEKRVVPYKKTIRCCMPIRYRTVNHPLHCLHTGSDISFDIKEPVDCGFVVLAPYESELICINLSK